MRPVPNRQRTRLRLGPYHVEVCQSPIAVQHLTFTPCFAESQANQTSSNFSLEAHQPNFPLPVNLIRNTRVGEPLCSQPVHTSTPPHPPNTSANQAGPSFTPSHSSPRPRLPSTILSQPAEPGTSHAVQNPPRMRRKPRSMTEKGLKQSMGLHANETSRHAYNRFRVRSFFYYCSSTDHLSSQDRVRAKMKEKGEGLWVAFDDVPRPYQDWLVNEVSKSTSFLGPSF